MTDIFYVYEHWRPDLDVCFYVGKGQGNRARGLRRNIHHGNVVKKLSRLGMCVEVRMVQSGLTECAALRLEMDRIRFWREAKVKLTNHTDGGEGVSGLKHTHETRMVMSLARKGKKNPAHSAKLKGRALSELHRASLSEAQKGRVVSVETRNKISAKHSGRTHSEESKKNMSAAHVGTSASEGTRQKMSVAHKGRWADPDLRISISSAMKAHWQNPAYRSRLLEKRKAATSDPAYRAKLSLAAKEFWARRKGLVPCTS